MLLLLGYVASGVSLMLALSLATRIPYAGWIILLAALLLGLGALLTQLRRAVRP